MSVIWFVKKGNTGRGLDISFEREALFGDADGDGVRVEVRELRLRAI